MDFSAFEHQIDQLEHTDIPQAHLPEHLQFTLLPAVRMAQASELRALVDRWQRVHDVLPEALSHRIGVYVLNVAGTISGAVEEARALLRSRGPNDGAALRASISEIEGKLQANLEKFKADRNDIELTLYTGEVRKESTAELLLRQASELEANLREQVGAAISKNAALARSIDERQQNIVTAAFKERAEVHRHEEREWYKYFIVSLGLLAVVLFMIFSNHIPQLSEDQAGEASKANTTITIAVYVFQNVLGLLVATFFVRLTLKRWNLERNLHLVYSHRVAALQQLELFTENFSPEEKSALRVAIGKDMFADPRTGYLDESTSDVSVAPVVNILDRVAKRD